MRVGPIADHGDRAGSRRQAGRGQIKEVIGDMRVWLRVAKEDLGKVIGRRRTRVGDPD
jgi:uncharacterized protein YjbJ (UPF0337 family)